MSDEYLGKTFKSGNSVAVRLPKGMGIPEGTAIRMVKEAPMSFRFEAVDAPARKVSGEGWIGKAPWLKPLSPQDRELDDRELDWEGRKLKRDG